MDKNIEGVITSLLSDTNTGNALSEILREIALNKKDGQNSNSNDSESASSNRLQKKIDAISSLLPVLSPENAEQAKFIIRILTTAKFISELK